ncbi:hypothetical protein Tco_1482565 [Tanacetum coccineum]
MRRTSRHTKARIRVRMGKPIRSKAWNRLCGCRTRILSRRCLLQLHMETTLLKILLRQLMYKIQKLLADKTSFEEESTATMPYVSAASTPTGENVGESSFVYLGGKIPIDASTLLFADLLLIQLC